MASVVGLNYYGAEQKFISLLKSQQCDATEQAQLQRIQVSPGGLYSNEEVGGDKTQWKLC